VAAVRGHDLALYAAGVTFYATVGLVPLLLLSLFLAGQVAGEDTVRGLADELASLLPDELGAQEAGRFLGAAGTSMSPLAAVAPWCPPACTARAWCGPSTGSASRPAGGGPCAGGVGSLVVVAASPLLLLGGLSAARGLTGALG
jgi:membrane protein